MDPTTQLAADLHEVLGQLRRKLRAQADNGELTASQLHVLRRLEREGPATATTLRGRIAHIFPNALKPVLTRQWLDLKTLATSLFLVRPGREELQMKLWLAHHRIPVVTEREAKLGAARDDLADVGSSCGMGRRRHGSLRAE